VRAIQISRFGGPEVLQLVDLDDPAPQPGQALIRVSRAGVNYADMHQTENTYLSPTTVPMVPGAEVVGTTEDGRRVVALVRDGGYAELALAPEQLLFTVPAAVSDGQALALVLQGTTAWHLLRTSAHLRSGETVVVHAAAGGVGSIAVQLARSFGAGRVIATASTTMKRELALDLGADATIDSTADGLRDRLLDANDGRQVDVVLEMAGGAVFDASLRALAPFGRLVSYGMAGRQAPKPVEAARLMAASRAVIGFWLGHCFARPEMIATALSELMGLTSAGRLRPVVGGEYPLSRAGEAHADLLARRTVGKLVLDPAR
jgi:NADPH2:quinone reductase